MNDASTHKSRTASYLIPVLLVSVIVNIPKFFESQVKLNKFR